MSMINNYFFPRLVLLLLFTGGLSGAAQNFLLYPKEKMSLQTDRSLYISGEKILFVSSLLFQDAPNPIEASKILYCELISPEGAKLAAGKFLFVNGSCSESLTIPSDLITGIYYLRVYTKVMRNEGPRAYTYAQLKIVNPGRPDVMNPGLSVPQAGKPEPDSPNVETEKLFSIHTDKDSYLTRQKATAIVESTGAGKGWPGNFSLSVVPDSTCFLNPGFKPETKKESGKQQYYPEIQGISISGRLIDKQSGTALPLTRINLSILGEKDFMAVQTDTAGYFFFSLPDLTGNRDLFLCAEFKPGLKPSIRIDNDYCPLEIRMPASSFSLSEAERKAAFNLAVNTEVESIFRNDTVQPADTAAVADRPFYGKPSQTLMIDHYVQLPTLEEYFNELPGVVRVRQQQGKPYFKFSGLQPEMNIYDPLVLIDWVAVDDMEKVMSISPQSVNRIELVNAPYIKGNFIYGGIVSIISRRGDFAGIDLPSSGVFINYKFLTPSSHSVSIQDYAVSQPDARNTLYWNPQIKLTTDGRWEGSFTTPDSPGKYIVVLKGISGDGKPGTWQSSFLVK